MRKINQTFNFIAKFFQNLVFNEKQKEQIILFIEKLEEWNRKINLTAIRDIDRMFIRHILEIFLVLQDSLIINKCHFFDNINIIDLGSGAGIPAIPLQIMLPLSQVTSVEKNKKKAAFQSYIKSELALTNLKVEPKRLEEVESNLKYNIVVSRALSSLETLCEQASLFLQPGGCLLAWKSYSWREEYMKVDQVIMDKLPLLHIQEYKLAEYDLQGVILLFKKIK